MTDEDSLQPLEAVAASQRSCAVKLIFYGAQGLRAGWKVLLFAAFVITLFLATRPLINLVAPRSPTGSLSLQADLIREFWLALLVLVATSVMARLERRPLRSYGYTDRAGIRRLCFGACWGFLSISFLVAALWLHGSLVFDGFSSANRHVLPGAAASILGALLVGLVEESLLRGYLQFVLSRALGFWWAALSLSLLFGLLHGGNGGETWLGLFGAVAGGLFFCLSLWYTKSLFWAVGFHSGFDWGESYLYGTPDSGEVAPWRLIATHPTGDALWSGGSAGPEASLLLVPLLVASIVVMCLWWERGRLPWGCASDGTMREVRARAWLLLILCLVVSGSLIPQASAADWKQFGWDVASSGASTDDTGITTANAASLQRRQVALDGTVDASAIYLHGIEVKGARHDVFFVTTTYGKTIAIDADQGSVLWEYTPPKIADWEGSRQITTSTPAADPDRNYIYAAAPDGTVQKLAVADGRVLWTTPITHLPAREKIASPLREFRGRIIAVTSGYYGDRPPYQGHVAILDALSGELLHVWNSLCSGQPRLLVPSECPSTESGIWGRAGAVVDPATGDIFVATGNGPYNGKTDWGDSTIQLDKDAAQMLGNFTPSNNAKLDERDLDIGSTSPVLLGDGLVAQGGKDKQIRLLELGAIAGVAPHQGHERQILATPSGGMLFTAPAVWRNRGTTWMFAADGGGTAAWTLEGGKLVERWKNGNGGTSPVIAGGLLYVYDPKGKLRIYEPTKGNQIADLGTGSGHWNSPIVVDGRIALPEGNANRHARSGVLDIWSLAAPK